MLFGSYGGAFRAYLANFGWVVLEEPKVLFGDFWWERMHFCDWGVIYESPGYIWCPVVGL